MSRLERLLNLTAALLSTSRPLTAQEVHERVPGYPEGAGPAYHRAFERDKDALREMGVPVRVEVVAGTDPPIEGYRIRREDYELRDPGLAPDELAALHLATLLVQVEGLAGRPALWKLGGVPGGVEEPAVVTVPTWPQLVPLWRAVAERRAVGFDYRDQHRQVEPWRVSYSRGHWYVDGHDRDRGEQRRFRLDRMGPEVDLGEPGAFVRPATIADSEPHPWELGDEPAVLARMAVDADQAGWAIDQVGPEAVRQRLDDGGVILELTVTDINAFRSFALGFLDHAEVLAPPELRDDIVHWVEVLAGSATVAGGDG